MSAARIHERGYRRYEGDRRGVASAVATTVRHTLRYLLGLRRRARSKVVPWGIAALAYLPAIGFVAVTLFLPRMLLDLAEEVLPPPGAYLVGITLLVYLAAALAGPAALCNDRRHGTIALYLASPLNRNTYLAAKALAVVVFMSLVTVVPPLLYVLGTVLSGLGPDGPVAVLVDVGRAVGGGLAWALLYGSLSLAIASFTERQIVASAGVVLYAMISGSTVAAVVFGLGAPEELGLLDVNQVAFHVLDAFFGDPLEVRHVAAFGAFAGWVALFGGVAWWRYRRLEVAR